MARSTQKENRQLSLLSGIPIDYRSAPNLRETVLKEVEAALREAGVNTAGKITEQTRNRIKNMLAPRNLKPNFTDEGIVISVNERSSREGEYDESYRSV